MRARVLVLPLLLISFNFRTSCAAIDALGNRAADHRQTQRATAIETEFRKSSNTEANGNSASPNPPRCDDQWRYDDQKLPDDDQGDDLVIPYKYVGNRYSHKFHRLDCPFALVMSKWNVEYFRFRKDAIEHGEKPCHWCLPPWWKSVSATIVGSGSAKTKDHLNSTN